MFAKVEPPPSPAAPAAASPRSCPTPGLAGLRREDFDALLAAGAALRCHLVKGEMWDEVRAMLARDPAEPLALWIAPVLSAAPEPLREELRAALWRHPHCGVRAAVLSKNDLETAMNSSCWRLQAAALRAGAKADGASLPSFLRPPRAY